MRATIFCEYTIQYTIFVSKPSASVPQNCRSQKGQKGPRAPELDHSRRPIGKSRMHFPYLSSSPIVPAAQQTLCKASAEDIIDSDLNIVYQAMVSGGTTSETFMRRA